MSNTCLRFAGVTVEFTWFYYSLLDLVVTGTYNKFWKSFVTSVDLRFVLPVVILVMISIGISLHDTFIDA